MEEETKFGKLKNKRKKGIGLAGLGKLNHEHYHHVEKRSSLNLKPQQGNPRNKFCHPYPQKTCMLPLDISDSGSKDRAVNKMVG